MKILSPSAIESLLDRFDNFVDAEFRSVEVVDPFKIKVTLATQDKTRDFDWITLTLLFSEVKTANLIEETRLGLLDTEDGCSLIFDNSHFAFCVGKCYNSASLQSTPFFIVAKTLKYEEGSF